MGMLIDSLMPLTTLVIFMGGNSGQMIVETIRKNKAFAKYDNPRFGDNGGVYRPIYLPYHDRHYISRLQHADKMEGLAGEICWIKTEENRQWLRSMTEEWIANTWVRYQLMPLDEIISNGLFVIVPTHLSPEFAEWVLPDARKLYVTDYNSYFAVRADREKNMDKHPTDRNNLIRYCAERTAVNRAWNAKTFPYSDKSIVFHRSDLITDDRTTHGSTFKRIMDLHGVVPSDSEMEEAWNAVRSYNAKQRELGYIR